MMSLWPLWGSGRAELRGGALSLTLLACLLLGCHGKHDVAWRELVVVDKRGKYVVEKSNYYLEGGHTLGIIGPSGSGKSTFLTSLAGILPSASLTSGGEVMVSSSSSLGRPLELSDVAFLAQDDAFFSMLTVEETLQTEEALQQFESSKERLLLAEKERADIVNSLGLSKLLKRRIGNKRVGGTSDQATLSGGERRRLSVAVEMMSSDVKVILADEPTTGLDASQAQKVVKKISSIAKQKGIAAVMALHAPRGSIYELLDDIMLLAPNGRPIYIGEAKSACGYFAKLGYKCPSNTNVAEFLIDLVSVDTEDEEQAIADKNRINELASAFRRSETMRPVSAEVVTGTNAHLKTKRTRQPFLKRVAILVKRSFLQNLRDVTVNSLRLGACGALSFIFSKIFGDSLDGEPTAKSVADRTALLSYAVINMSMMALLKTLDLFAREKPVVMRERMRGHYDGAEYIIAKVIAEVPLDASFSVLFAVMLKQLTNLALPTSQLAVTLAMATIATDLLGFAVGSIASTADAAMATGTPLMIVYMVLGIINPAGVDKAGGKSLPWFLNILKLASPIRWAIESLACAEFRGMKLSRVGRPSMGALSLVRSGDQVLEALGLGSEQWIDGVKKLAKLGGVEMLVSIAAQHIMRPISSSRNLKEPKRRKKHRNSTSGATAAAAEDIHKVPVRGAKP